MPKGELSMEEDNKMNEFCYWKIDKDGNEDKYYLVSKLKGTIINSDFHGFTEYQGPEKWEKIPEEGRIGRPYNLFICNRCLEFMFWSRVYGGFPVLDPFTEIDSYREARMIAENHQKHFCHKDDKERR